jgi:hypothetical protein
MADIARIEDRIDRVAASTLEVSDALGGLRFQNMVEVMEFAKCMAIAETAVPKHLRGNPGMCLAVCIQALEWRFSPFAVANKSYVVNDRIGYESQLVHAVIEQRAPIIGRLKHKFDGEDGQRRCIVTATLRETGETLEYISPPFDKIQPKNSPLWKTKPDLQLYYNTSRDFCRAYFPDVLLGVYSQEELRDHVGPDNAKDVNDRPSVGQRLKAKGARGFNASHVERETRGGVVDDSAPAKEAANHSETPHDATRHDQNFENLKTDVQPDAGNKPSPLEPMASAQERVTTGSGEAQDRCVSASPTDSNSSQPGPPAEADAPASTGSPALDAGNPSSGPAPADDEAQAGESSQGAGLPSNLPEGWPITYAAALRRAQKKESLSKYAADYWKQYGGWDQVKLTGARDTAAAVYDAFDNNFGNKEAIERDLREIV